MILVTGGAGFIGSAIVWGLNNLGFTDIIIVDHLGDGDKWKNLRNLKYKDYVEKDDFYSNIDAYSSIDTIFHMGACSSTTEQNLSYMIKNNFETSKILAKFAMSKNIQFIYASSAATYGETDNFSDDLSRLNSLRSLNKYGYSKHIFDRWLLENGFFNKKKIIGLKFFNVYGPNEYHKGEMRSFILKGFEDYIKYGKINLFSNALDCKRDFIYIKDVVDMTLFFINRMPVSGLFNIGSGVASNWKDVAHNIVSTCSTSLIADMNFHHETIDMPANISHQYQKFTQADISKIRQAGYSKPIMNPKAAIQDYIDNYLKKTKYLGD